MEPIITGAAITAGSQLISDIIKARREKIYQNQMLKKQNEYNVENWRRENAYNTPAAQMNRLRAANLNPNLVYNSGAASDQSGTIDPASLMNYQEPSYGEALATGVDTYFRGKQLENEQTSLMSLIAYRDTLNAYNRMREEGQSLSNRKEESEQPYWHANAYQRALQVAEETKIMKSTNDKLRAETALDWQNNRYTRQAIKNLKKNYELTDTQIKQAETGMRKMNSEIWQIYYDAGIKKLNYDLSVAEKTAVIAKYTEEITKLQAETQNIKSTNDLKSFLAAGRAKMASELRGEHGRVSQAAAQMVFTVFDLMQNMPFSGININP